jgi:hypothetical protein
VAHRVFRGFPSSDQIGDRIEAFVAFLAQGQYARALTLCPIENLAHQEYAEAELESHLARRCLSTDQSDVAVWASRLGRLDRSSITLTRGAEEVPVQALFRGQAPAFVASFLMTESPNPPSDRWSMWFERFAAH